MLYDDLIQPGEYICHHGVKGQKWGVRHDREKTDRKTKSNNKKSFNSLTWTKLNDHTIRTKYNGLSIAMFTDTRFFEQNKATCTALLNNWDKIIKTTDKASSEYITKRFTTANWNVGESVLSGFWVGGSDVVAMYDNDYGVVDVEIDPVTQRVYGCSYND
jgi:hypothetical protein